MKKPFYDEARGLWRLQWIDEKTGKRRSRRFPKESDALRFALDLESGAADTQPVRARQVTFGEFIERWHADYAMVEKSETTWADDAGLLKNHLLPLLAEVRLADLRGIHLDAVKAEMKRKRGLLLHGKKPLSNKTINTTLQLGKQIMACAQRWGLVPINPFVDVRLLKVPKRSFAYWTVAERERFLAEAAKEDPAFARLVTVACHTGLRRGELQALRGHVLDFARLKIRVEASWSWRLKRLVPTKNGEIADVPMNGPVVEALSPARFAPRAKPVFEARLFSNLRRRMDYLATLAGVPTIRFHDLRHTFASTLAMAGVDLMQIQQLMRHKSYHMTLRYSHLRPEHLKGATDCLVASPPAAAPILRPSELREA